VWVQFIICYNSSIFRVLQEGGLEWLIASL
jgi:hypothetical protein